MKNTLSDILVFATNIRTNSDKQLISRIFDEHSEIQEWNIDQEDIDCVLRIVTKKLSEEQIVHILQQQNFNCTPLE
ncbi:hypothetical protein [Flavobacterium flavigenum]|uniref:hypothetical protein n=1 Tax=Flavobacterium flavigenum TaxID=3003258 RepID=UPI0022ABFC30|nr:hypothetical protein [Flavobacterium flavigenum]